MQHDIAGLQRGQGGAGGKDTLAQGGILWLPLGDKGPHGRFS